MAQTQPRRAAPPDGGGGKWVLGIAVLALALLVGWFFFAGDREPPSGIDVDMPEVEAPEIDVDVRPGGEEPEGPR